MLKLLCFFKFLKLIILLYILFNSVSIVDVWYILLFVFVFFVLILINCVIVILNLFLLV